MATSPQVTGHQTPSRCFRSPSPSAKRIKLSNGTSNMSTTSDSVVGVEALQTIATKTNKQQPAQTHFLNSATTAETSYAPPTPTMQALVEEEMEKPIEVMKTYQKELDYENKLVLAPMVRTGSFGDQQQRLLSLHYGAGLVWGPEIVDKAIIGAERIVDRNGVITYTKKGGDGKPIFSCHPVEKPFLIYQIGTSDPELAVLAAKTVEQDVAGFVHSGMGAALLSTPDLLLSILRALLNNVSVPISCKIRLLPDQPATLHLASRILRTGVRALTVHCRTRDMRSSVKALWERLGDIVQLGKRRGVPVLCNGDGEGWANWKAIREMTGATSVMIARAAESNPSIFNPTGPISTMERLIPTTFLPVCVFIANHYSNTKFLLYQFKPSTPPISNLTKAERKTYSDGIAAAKTIEQAVQFFGLTMDDARTTGEQFMKDLKKTLKEREPEAYGTDEFGDDWVKAALAAAPQHTLNAPTKPQLAIPAHHVEHHTKDIFKQRKEAEVKGKVQDMPATASTEGQDNGPSEVLQQEELDEEAMMNA
ncbi:hypothetical protein QFC21_004854 [Naganishia friedmannii]|uniref:Uncharacterized protein n=1 Tax=Naganishia friedmannii TaxID=89922 RepID=A0ACC2VE26_9TREE|nr:hypothetical protein QFC21_004854 [Naganishia friedmannii]